MHRQVSADQVPLEEECTDGAGDGCRDIASIRDSDGSKQNCRSSSIGPCDPRDGEQHTSTMQIVANSNATDVECTTRAKPSRARVEQGNDGEDEATSRMNPNHRRHNTDSVIASTSERVRIADIATLFAASVLSTSDGGNCSSSVRGRASQDGSSVRHLGTAASRTEPAPEQDCGIELEDSLDRLHQNDPHPVPSSRRPKRKTRPNECETPSFKSGWLG